MIALTLDLQRINKGGVFAGKTDRRYLSFILIDAPDQYGNAGQVVHSISREERAADGKGEIVGSWKHLGVTKTGSQAKPVRRHDDPFNSLAPAFDAADDEQRKTPL